MQLIFHHVYQTQAYENAFHDVWMAETNFKMLSSRWCKV
jgi:hypothetical protein